MGEQARPGARLDLQGGVLLLVGVAALSGCVLVADGPEEFGADAENAVEPMEVAAGVIDGRDIARHIDFLASDVMRGRATPSEQLDRAAAWVAERLRTAGFQPAGEHGGFMQLVPADTGFARNVVAVLPGTDPALTGEYVVVTAHFDHLGVGDPDEDGDSIYNGADDNASGVAAMVEVAEAFGALPRRLPRPLLFLAFSGSERDLMGSTWFADNPTVLLSEAVAVLNLEMIGRNHPDTVGLVGYGYSGLGPLLERIAGTEELGLTVDRDPSMGEDPFRAGDHWPLVRSGIPAVVITTARHEDYHTPNDESDRVDPDKVARIARLVFLAVHELAGEDVVVEWTEEGRRAGR